MKKLFNLFLSLVLSLYFVVPGYSADQWAVSSPAGTDNASDLDTLIGVNNAALDRLAYTYRQGCKIAYASASTLTVDTGALALPNSAGTVVRWRRNTSVTTISFSNIDTGAEAASTTYYIYGLADTDATTFTVKISTSSSAPTGATYYRRLGYFYNDASSNITQIVNDDNSGNIAYVKGQGNYYRIDSGTTGSIGSGTQTGQSVSFSFTFASAPIVLMTCYDPTYGDGIGGDSGWFIQSISTTGFTFGHYNAANAVYYKWIAIGQVLAQ